MFSCFCFSLQDNSFSSTTVTEPERRGERCAKVCICRPKMRPGLPAPGAQV
ncbi:FAM13C isoform 10 [Pan troglodytes]|uniref:Family with sequence similarity 13 member C n=2 Tax=Homininae TaxID=207598 RepID=A0A087X2G4_HUMAN|nr:family with sequence similarity 13 member C [Homo sapiens]PNI75768.1 FAM13C isoform 6 [Pan troglodytes]KAI2555884.1 family with sequence similarity 13 member C [Homo sapiens]KAI4076062.1 family with sequence similarity 13 member C [Homo sapiens]KAI4076068.1 family with sequence similarity 13 member C [Homo sapiens]